MLTGVTGEVVVLALTGVEVTAGADDDGVVTGTGVLAGGALDHSLQPELGTAGDVELVTTGGAGGGVEVVTTGGAGTVVVDHTDQV